MKTKQCYNKTEAVVFGFKVDKQIKEEINNESEEMAQWLRLCSTLTEFSSLVSITHMGNSQLTVIPALGVFIALFWHQQTLNCVQTHKCT